MMVLTPKYVIRVSRQALSYLTEGYARVVRHHLAVLFN